MARIKRKLTIIGTKTVAAAGTSEKLVASSQLEQHVIIQALDSNTGKVYIGDSSLVAAPTVGWTLLPGEGLGIDPDSYEGDENIAIVDLSEIYVNASVNGEGVLIMALREVDFTSSVG